MIYISKYSRRFLILLAALGMFWSAYAWAFVSDFEGAIRHIAVSFGDYAAIPAYHDLFLKMPPYVKITIVVPDKRKKIIIKQLIKSWGVKNSGRIELLEANAPVSPWIRDPFVVNVENDVSSLIFRKVYPEVRSALDDAVLKRIFSGKKKFVIRSGPFMLDGGNFLAGNNVVLVGNNAYVQNLDNTLFLQEEFASKLRTLFKVKRVVVVGGYYNEVPYGHLDMFMTLLPGRVVLVGDPFWGAKLLERAREDGLRDYLPEYFNESRVALTQSVKSAIFSDKEFVDQMGIFFELRRKSMGHMLDELIRRNKDTALYRKFDSLVHYLKGEGFRVIRIPVILNNPSDQHSPFITYNNVLLETGADLRRVYLPFYGIPVLDRSAADVFKSLGFSFRRIDTKNTSFLLGSVRCLTQVLDRK